MTDMRDERSIQMAARLAAMPIGKPPIQENEMTFDIEQAVKSATECALSGMKSGVTIERDRTRHAIELAQDVLAEVMTAAPLPYSNPLMLRVNQAYEELTKVIAADPTL